MVDPARAIDALSPFAARLITADQRAIASLSAISWLPGCSAHPRDTSMAWLRRASVATEVEDIAAHAAGWRDPGYARAQGCFEVEVDDDLVLRLSTDYDGTAGPPATGSMFAVANLAHHGRGRLLLRLRGDVLRNPIFDVASISGRDHVDWKLTMAHIASQTPVIAPIPTPAPPRPVVTLPGSAKRARRADAGQ